MLESYHSRLESTYCVLFATCFAGLCTSRCTDFSKRMAKGELLLENDDGTWRVIFDNHIVPEPLFRKMYPPPQVLPEWTNPKCGSPYGDLGALSNITRVWNFAGECLTMEATLPPTKPSDCQGHFFNNPTLPHSIMVFHNCGTSSFVLSLESRVNVSPFNLCNLQILSDKPCQNSPAWTSLSSTATLVKIMG